MSRLAEPDDVTASRYCAVPNSAKLAPLAALLQSGSAPDSLLSALLDAIPEPIVIYDRQAQFVFANTAGQQYFEPFGITPEGCIASSHASGRFFEMPSGRPLTVDDLPLARAFRGEPEPRVEFLVTGVDGQPPFWLDCSARPLITPTGEWVGVILTIRNITSVKEKDAEVAAQRLLLDHVFDRSLAGVVHSTFEGDIIDCNDAFANMLGYATKDELLGLNVAALHFFAETRVEMLRQLESRAQLSEYEICYRHKDGSPRWGLINVSVFRPLGAESRNVISTVVDITARRLSEESVRQSERRFAAFMRHLPGVAFTKDLDGRYVYYNEAAWPLFGKPPEALIGRRDEEIWPAEDAALYRSHDEQVIATGRPVEVLEPGLHADGRHFWLMYKFPIVENGRVVLIGGIGIDVTERQRLEEQLAQTSRMEALGRLAGGVAHDFNNLLTIISGYGQLLIEGLAPSAGATMPVSRLTSYADEVLNSARRAASLTSQLLAFSRRQNVEPDAFDLRGLVLRLEQLLGRMLGEDIELTVHCDPEPCPVRADVHQMEQALINLAVNARDALPLGGTLGIECRRVESPPGVLLEVRDDGIGMDETTREHLFEPFFTSKPAGKGTGLGLSTVYGVISQAAGTIDVESAPGEGTIFRIRLPLVENFHPRESVSAEAPAPGSELVLVVEDEPSLRALIATILGDIGYRVEVAESGAEALEIVARLERPVDVVLTDVIMPRMSGAQLVVELRKADPGLRVLFMSGYTDDMLAGYGILKGQTRLIQKPFTADSLARALRSVLDAPAGSPATAA